MKFQNFKETLNENLGDPREILKVLVLFLCNKI